MAPAGRARVPLTPEQEEDLKAAYNAVPKTERVVHEWNSPEGREFRDKVRRLTEEGSVPITWIADVIGISPVNLGQMLGRP